MGSHRRDRVRRAGRGAAHLEPRPRILVVCEGEITERQYLGGFRDWCRNPRVEVRLEGPGGVPLTLVKRAKELKRAAEEDARRERDENLLYEQVWCVFDFDEHPNIPQARQLARDNGLRLAMSNPCFELWLLLHLRDNPGAQHRHHLQDMLAELMPGVPPKHIDFALLVEGYEQAVLRAKYLEDDAVAADEAGRNPTTEVFHLTDSIDMEGKIRRASRKAVGLGVGRQKAEAAARAAFEQAEREQTTQGHPPISSTMKGNPSRNTTGSPHPGGVAGAGQYDVDCGRSEVRLGCARASRANATS